MKTKFLRILSLMLVVIVLSAAALTFASCDNNAATETGTATGTATATGTGESQTETTIQVEVVNDKGESKTFTITTAEKTLRGALEQIDLVKGEESKYGLYIKEVDGLLADYDVNGAYWGMYKDGEYLMSGVDTTYIADGDHYELVYSK